MLTLFNFWRNPCTVFHIFHSQECTCTQVSVSLHSHQHWLFSGGCFVLEGVCVCVRGLNNSHSDGYDVVSHCGFDLFNFVTARPLLCCFRLHVASLPVSSPAAACLLSWHVHWAPTPLHILLTTFYLRADETGSSLSISVTFKHLKDILTPQTQPRQREGPELPRRLLLGCVPACLPSLPVERNTFCSFPRMMLIFSLPCWCNWGQGFTLVEVKP